MNRIVAITFFTLISIGFAACSGGGCGQQEEETKMKCGPGTRLVGTTCQAVSRDARF